MSSSSRAAWRGQGLSDVGRVRSSNQDAFALFDDRGVWVIADGMGGHAGGHVASQTAVSAIASYSEPLETGSSVSESHPDAVTFLRQAIEQANRTIRHEALNRPELTGMGTTIVLLHIIQDPALRAVIAHVGDSRAYLIRDRMLTQLTQDHSWVEEQIRHGRLGQQDADKHPMRHVLTRALGTEATVVPDVTIYPLESEDQILLCTDGLTKMLDDEQILRAVLGAGSASDACQVLITAANQLGGSDNTTVLIVRQRS